MPAEAHAREARSRSACSASPFTDHQYWCAAQLGHVVVHTTEHRRYTITVQSYQQRVASQVCLRQYEGGTPAVACLIRMHGTSTRHVLLTGACLLSIRIIFIVLLSIRQLLL